MLTRAFCTALRLLVAAMIVAFSAVGLTAQMRIDGVPAILRLVTALLLPDGSAANPALRFTSDTDTGWFWSTNVIGQAFNGTMIFRNDANGLYWINHQSGQIQLGTSADVTWARGGAGLHNFTDGDGTPDLNINISGVPTLSTCGDGALATGSSNTSGRVTGTTQTACTLTFSASFGGNSADCFMQNLTSEAQGIVSAASATAFTVSLLTAGDDFSYLCVGR